MGVDLCQYGNHKVNFKGRDLIEVAEEIKERLNSIKLVNIDYIKLLMNFWDHSDGRAPEILLKNEKIGIFKKIIEEEWNWEYEIINDTDEEESYHYQYIRFIGFRNFELEFTKDKIFFWQPPYRFIGWFLMDKLTRDQWRIYMFQIINSLGGNRAIYLPDNMLDAEIYLDEHDGVDSPFEEIEQDLIKEYGKFEKKIDDINNEDDFQYFIDDFSGLKLENEITVKEFQDYLWKKCVEDFKDRMNLNENDLEYYLNEILVNNNAEKLVLERMEKWRMENKRL
jgi:hypothetical protein